MMLPPQTKAQMAADFFRAWYGHEFEEQYATISQLAPGKGRVLARHRHAHPAELVEAFEYIGMDDLVYESERQWNLYMSVGVMKEMPARGRKGGKNDIVAVPGVWVDLDTDKSGFFDDEEHCLGFLRSLDPGVWPTIVVATGTGGVHAYWRTDMVLSRDRAEQLCTMWWTYLSSLTDRKIDKLVNADRIMKLPGSVRWPKMTGDAPTLVRLLHADEVRRVPAGLLEDTARESYDRHVSEIRSRRERVQRNKLEAAKVAGDLSGWNYLIALATVEDQFNEQYDWEDILVPLGWTKLEQDADGRDIWSRPGLVGHEMHKSAATGYDGSHVMSLFSDSEETGLSHLVDTGVTLTKYRVYVETVWHGDEAGFVRAYLKGDDIV